MIWAIIYLILLYVMVSSALLAGRRRYEANFLAEKAVAFVDSKKMGRVEVSI